MHTTKRGEWCVFAIPSVWDGKTIEQILKEEWRVPKKTLHQYRMEKAVLYNGEIVRWTEPVNAGEIMEVRLFPDEEYGVFPEKMDVEIAYEDDHVLIVNKPYGMDTHPSEKGGRGTLANGIAYYLEMKGIRTKVRHIHRLDKDTTGGVIFAKHALSGAIMDRLLIERNIKRTYWALVEGRIKQEKGKVDAPIGRDRHHATRRRVSPKGDQAITYYKALRYLPEKRVTLVELQLETGRTHQIRVHMSYLGHPLAGDSLYGGRTELLSRQALHAARIHLRHPITNERLEVMIPLPQDFAVLIQ